MRTLARRVELLEARHRAAAGVPSLLESHFNVDAWYATLTDDEVSTLEAMAGVDPAVMDGDDLEVVANLSERLKAFRLDRS